MAVAIRMHRYGRKKRAFYRIVAVDSRKRRDGSFLDILGTYNPVDDREGYEIRDELVLGYLRNGAIPSDTVKNMLKKVGVWEKFLAEKSKNIVEKN